MMSFEKPNNYLWVLGAYISWPVVIDSWLRMSGRCGVALDYKLHPYWKDENSLPEVRP
jgi:hypothetical protein